MTVWDPFVRLFHWSLAVFFFLAYYLEGEWIELHSHAGYTAGLLVLFRVLWGLLGPETARFASFVVSAGAVLAYLRQLVKNWLVGEHVKRAVGHDPAGAVMILILLLSILITAISGMSLFAMEGSGPLVGSFVTRLPGSVVEDVHEFFADFTLLMVCVHVIGVLVTSRLHRQNLIRAMISGKKIPDSEDVA
jgi:cytochrome b